ncbi:MAG TPA: hypothetical protein VI669_07315 [Vicinamibacteria bacterium]
MGALVATLALLAPWAQSVAVVAHDGAGQGHGHGHDPLDATLHVLEFFLHGHDHEPSTPAHSHEFVVAKAPLGVGRQSMMPHLYPAWPSAPVAVAPFEPRGMRARIAHGVFGVGPPPPSSLFSILRV